MSDGKDENIIVCVRCRPFNEREKVGGYKKVVKIEETGSVTIFGGKGGEDDVKTFQFDCAFDEDCIQVNNNHLIKMSTYKYFY